MTYPTRARYTLQWLINLEPPVSTWIRNNIDAAFKTGFRKARPSDLLLHYNYGAAAVKRWGQGVEFLQNSASPPRPSAPVPAPMGASKTVHDRTTATEKCGKPLRAPGVRTRRAAAGAGAGERVESEGQASWDEGDVILFCWGNSPAAKERNRKKVQQTTQGIEVRRERLPQGSAQEVSDPFMTKDQ